MAKKLSKPSVKYGISPTMTTRCSNCQNFEAPNACALVDGDISPTGTCTLFAAFEDPMGDLTADLVEPPL